MSGKAVEKAGYDLIDLETGAVVGQVTAAGEVIAEDARVSERVSRAFARELMVRDGDLVEELGVCFADVVMLCPGQPGHGEAVLRSLARLAGYLPRPHGEDP